VHPLVARRLFNQKLIRPCRTAVEVVSWLGAMQSQDYPGAKWGIGLRARVTDDEVEKACHDGEILRTHILRQTWHFVARADLRWMLALSGPRVNTVNAHYYRQFELDEPTFTRSRNLLERALRDRTFLTRPELAAALARAGIVASGPRLAFLIMRAELDAVVCSGPRRGNQLTYALLEERVPRAKAMPRDAALAELTRRYFASHGPATLKDYVWWSGLTVRDAKAGLDLAGKSLVQETVDGFTFWCVDTRSPKALASPSAYLQPNYDEYLIAHKDRHLVIGPGAERGAARIKDPFLHHVIVDGRLAGSWKRQDTASTVAVACAVYAEPTAKVTRALEAAALRLGRFLNRPATLSVTTASS
jgi:hypothetical protein